MTDLYIAASSRLTCSGHNCGKAAIRDLRSIRALLFSALLCLLAGCATRPEAVLRPISAKAPNASQVNMLVVTTRQAVQDPGQLYSGERGTAISFDSIEISIPPDRSRNIGEIQWPGHSLANPEREFAVLGVRKVASERQVLDWFRGNRNSKRQAVIFVHGFNNTYADAVFRFAQLKHDAGITAAPILFTWPSRGSVFDYLYDKESANYSRRALEDLIIQAARSPDVGEITIVAHSMGTWLAMEALRGVAMRQGGVPAKVNDVILASPDIDVDVFRRQMVEMGPKLPRFTIFTSTSDKALAMSRWLSGGINRVGGTDPTPYADILKRLGITVINTNGLESKDALGHNAFADSPKIIGLLGRQLAGQSLQPKQTALANRIEGFANFAGSATRAAISLPIAVANHKTPNLPGQEASGPKSKITDGQIAY
ncbi:alpha/beta hydrolase [Labrys portucalensis]|uniref:Alpha/beta hydrolase n=1 Tax=Labrys neptuniae TaxID=376174 RepID=A0ABV6ZRM3_9HYPH